MTAELMAEKRARLVAGLAKLKELRAAEPAGDPLAQERAAATHMTTTIGISRPLSDRYIALAAKVIAAGTDGAPEALFPDDAIASVSRLDDKFGAAFMVLAEHVDHILKGG